MINFTGSGGAGVRKNNVARKMVLSILAVAFVMYWSRLSSASDRDSAMNSPRQLSVHNDDAKKQHAHKHKRQMKQQHQQNSAAVCSQEDLTMLTALINTDPENLSLRPLSISRAQGGGEFHFSGLGGDLVSRAFLGTRIAIVGDSTLNNFYVWMEILLGDMMESHPAVLSSSLQGMTLSEGNLAVSEFSGCPLGKQGTLKGRMEDSCKFFESLGDSALMFERISEDISDALPKIVEFGPKVIIANIGLHLLHMQNHGRDVDSILPWLEYEISLEKVVAAAEASGAEVLLFKTTNFVCGEQYLDAWQFGNELYSAGDRKTLDACFASLIEKNHDTISDEDIENYCENAVINENGGSLLNQRLHQFFADASIKRQNSTLKLAVFNDHDIQSCESTGDGDGRHYHPLNLARIRLLGNYLDCLYNWNGLVESQ